MFFFWVDRKSGQILFNLFFQSANCLGSELEVRNINTLNSRVTKNAF